MKQVKDSTKSDQYQNRTDKNVQNGQANNINNFQNGPLKKSGKMNLPRSPLLACADGLLNFYARTNTSDMLFQRNGSNVRRNQARQILGGRP